MVIFVIATHYEGDPPDNSVDAWDRLQKIEEPTYFSGMKYMFFALGDLTYKHYCGFGKNISKKLTECGGELIHTFGTGSNDQNKIEIPFIEWRDTIWTELVRNAPVFVGGEIGSNKKYEVQLENGTTETCVDSISKDLIDEFDIKSGVCIVLLSELHKRIHWHGSTN